MGQIGVGSRGCGVQAQGPATGSYLGPHSSTAWGPFPGVMRSSLDFSVGVPAGLGMLEEAET